METVRCKFKLESVTTHMSSKSVCDQQGKHTGWTPCLQYTVEFSPVYSTDPRHENKRFWDATPGGKLTLNFINEMPWEIGGEYYMDIMKAKQL